MPPKGKYTDPKLREEVKEEIKEGDKGGKPGQWSARKAQMMAKEYKSRGGDYTTSKSDKDESAKHLDQWGEEDWQTKEGSGNAKKADGTEQRYLPKKAWDKMSEEEKKNTDDKKQKGSKDGKQFVGNTGKAKEARKEAQEDNTKGEDTKGTGKAKKSQAKAPPKTQAKAAQKSNKENDDDQHTDEAASEHGSNDSGDSEASDQKENQSPPQRQKRGRKQDDTGKEQQDQKKQKTASTTSKSTSKTTVGSKHDSSTPPAKQGSSSRLPKKNQKNVHWKAMPGCVEGEVVEVLKSDKEVDGKKVKATKSDPKVVLKSKTSGKICVHKADNVYFD